MRLWLHDRPARVWAVVIFAIAAVTGAASMNAALLISLGTAIALAALAPFDRDLARMQPVAALMAVGTFSFSLYLVHVPIGGRVTNLLDRLGLHTGLTIAISCAVSVGVAWLFYVAVERRALKRRAVAPHRVDSPAMSLA